MSAWERRDWRILERRHMDLNVFSAFLDNMDWQGLVEFLFRILLILLCLTVHELSHGYVAYRLGDHTAKDAGRLSLNPIKHIDLFGFLLMLSAGVGWAKAVPVDPRNFKSPKRDMALTALAGPVSNFLMALLAGTIFSILFSSGEQMVSLIDLIGWEGFFFAYQLLTYLVVLNVGLGIFNLFPIPPLDGSKVLFSILPEKIYWKILRYEKYVMGALIFLLWCGIFDEPLNAMIKGGLRLIGVLTGCPYWND